jgi:hypothetical protein
VTQACGKQNNSAKYGQCHQTARGLLSREINALAVREWLPLLRLFAEFVSFVTSSCSHFRNLRALDFQGCPHKESLRSCCSLKALTRVSPPWYDLGSSEQSKGFQGRHKVRWGIGFVFLTLPGNTDHLAGVWFQYQVRTFTDQLKGPGLVHTRKYFLINYTLLECVQ